MDDAAPQLPPAGNRFNELIGGGQTEDEKLGRALAKFEAARLRWLLARFKMMPHAARSLAQRNHERSGRWALTFDAFNELYDSFPFVLGASLLRRLVMPWPSKTDAPRRTEAFYHLHRDPYSTEPARFKKFSWVPFVVAYQQFIATLPADVVRRRKVALLFPRRGFKEGMVIHNDDAERYWEHGLCWVYKVPEQKERLYVQPLSALVESIYRGGHGWRPPRL